jgi:hypothetical protein
MLPRENYLFGCTRSKPIQGSAPAGLTLGSDFSFCFQCEVGSSLVLNPPIQITALTGQLGDLCRNLNFKFQNLKGTCHAKAAY